MTIRTYAASATPGGTIGLFALDGTQADTMPITVPGAAAAGVQPTDLTLAGSTLLFAGVNAAGNEVLYADKTTTGAVSAVAVSGAATTGLDPADITLDGSVALFTGVDTTGNEGLFAYSLSKGTAAEESVSGASGSGLYPTDLINDGATVLFSGTDAKGNQSLFAYTVASGTAAALTVSSASATGLNPQGFAANGGIVAFTGTDASGAQSLFAYNGAKGTVAEISVTGADSGGVNPAGLTAAGTGFVFAGTDTTGAVNLFVYTPSTAASAKLSVSGANAAGLDPANFTAVGSSVLFEGTDSAGQRAVFAYSTLTKAAAQIPVANVWSGGVDPTGSGVSFVAVGANAVFTGVDANGLSALFAYTAATHSAAEITPDGAFYGGLTPTGLTSNGTIATFYGLDSSGTYGLWQTDGTAAGTVEIDQPGTPQQADLQPSSLTGAGAEVVLAGANAAGHTTLFAFQASSGTGFEVPVLGASASGLDPSGFTSVGPLVFFQGTDAEGAAGLFTYNTATGAASEVSASGASVSGLDPSGFADAGAVVVFAGTDVNNRPNLFTYTLATGAVAEVSVSGASSAGLAPAQFAAVGSVVTFEGTDSTGNPSLFTYNATTGIAAEVSIPNASTTTYDDFNPAAITAADGVVLMSGVDSGGTQNLFAFTPGAATATEVTVTGATNGTSGLNPTDFVGVGSVVLFAGDQANAQVNLFAYTPATGTAAAVAEPAVGQNGLAPTDITTDGTVALFSGVDSANHTNLFRYTAATGAVAEINVAGASSSGVNPTHLTVVGPAVLFEGTDASGQNGLFAYNTATGSASELSIAGLGTGGLDPEGAGISIAATGTDALFTAIDAQGQSALFRYNATTGATEAVSVAGSDDVLPNTSVAYGVSLTLAVPAEAVPPPAPAAAPYGTELVTGTLSAGPGASAAGQAVTLLANGQTLATARPIVTGADGTFSATIVPPALSFTLGAQAADSSGNAISTTAPVDTHTDALLFGSVTTDPQSLAGQVFALYTAILDRAPDPGGLSSSVAFLASGATPTMLAQLLLSSSEFTDTQGPTSSLSPPQFVNLIYQDALGRAPDAAGEQAWVGALQAGDPQADVATKIALSSESISDITPAFTANGGTFVGNETDAAVARLYYGLLGRAPDAPGLQGWEGALNNGGSLTDVATAFLQSSEFQSMAAGFNTTQFLTLLYQDTLGRAPDQPGLQAWTGALNAGASQASVVLGFTNSAEAVQRYYPVIEGAFRIA